MSKSNKDKNIKLVQQKVGWAYKDNLWFSKEEAQAANKQRDELLCSLSSWVHYSAKGSKLYTGSRSPGCQICENGYWGCNFINRLCTQNCFFCPNDLTMKDESISQTDDFKFKNPMDHIHFLKTFGIKGVGFSGGEPLLVLDNLLSHITAIRKEFGNSMYQWMYTNGDLVNNSVLKRLRDAGLNEIRFNLSARNYDVSPLLLAKKYLSIVTVEIPAVPEEFELIKNLLVEWESMGVDFLNIHQLNATAHNYKSFRQRNYHILHQPDTPVFESEMCALKLLRFSQERKLSIPINYCCNAFKERFQPRGGRTRQGKIFLNGYEEITNPGFIRLICIHNSIDKLERFIRQLENNCYDRTLWHLKKEEMAIAIHSDLLPYVDWSTSTVTLQYLRPKLIYKEQKEIVKNNLAPMHETVFMSESWHRITFEAWRDIYIEKKDKIEFFQNFFLSLVKTAKGEPSLMMKETEKLKNISEYEEIEHGLPEVY